MGKIAMEFTDVLGNKLQFKTAIDIERELHNKPYWTVASRKVFPIKTFWEQNHAFENKYFDTEEDAWKAMLERIKDYIEKAKEMGENIHFEEVTI